MNDATQLPETLDILVIGAGFSGLCAGIKLLEKGITGFRIVEKSHGIGGTWYENTYPGAACDVPSHFYCFSFNPNPRWSRLYSPQAEIKDYIESCVDKYQLAPYIVRGAKVIELRLDEEHGMWRASFEDGRRVLARHVINGCGGLHLPSIPDFNGRQTFAGVSMHTAQWDHSVDMSGKNIAVIGSAASAIQAIPELAKVAARVVVFQRTPNYIVPRNDRPYTEREKRRFARWPWFARLYRWFIRMRMELLLFPIIKRNSWRGRTAARKVLRHMRDAVRDPALHDKLTPDYAMGCKRILLSDDFFDALNRDNVSLVTAGIDRIEPDGILTRDGELHQADVIVYATGFDIDTHIRSIRIIGEHGVTLDEAWGKGANAYNGACLAGFPNYYMVTGPNTGVGTTSVVYMIEQEIGYIMTLIDAAGADRLIAVKRTAQDAYNREVDAGLRETVWLSGCKSWYISANGRISTLYPKSGLAFGRQLARVRYEDFHINERRKTKAAA